jgi:GNAT superfamily N-acetyltransferase
VDFRYHVALVAELQDGSERTPVGVGRFVQNQDQPDHSEMAITVIDELQGQGIGKILLFRLVDCSRKLGVRHLDATALAQNKRITRLLRKTGLPLDSSLDEGIRTLSLAL